MEGPKNTVKILKGDYVIFPKGLKWFPKVAAGERGMKIDTPEYAALESVVLELGQRQCTPEDIEQKFLPVWRNAQKAFSIATKTTPKAQKLYQDLIGT